MRSIKCRIAHAAKVGPSQWETMKRNTKRLYRKARSFGALIAEN